MSSLTLEEVRGAKEIVPGQEYWIRPGVHLVLVEHREKGGVGCSKCVSMSGVAGTAGSSPCLVGKNPGFKTCLESSAYYWKIELVSKPPTSPTPVQPSLF